MSFASPQDADIVAHIGQSIMWDNGAFSLYTSGKSVNWSAYYKWLEPRLAHPHWAVIPDVIGGDDDANLELIRQWPFRPELSAPVWHMGVSLDILAHHADNFGRVCFGSSGAYWQVGSEPWSRRCDEAFNFLAQRGPLPWVHMLRGMAVSGKRWPFASVDSVNVARNFKDTNSCPEAMARTIDAVQCPAQWHRQYEQMELIA